MPDVFQGNEILLTSHETLSFSLLTMLVKLMIFNAINSSMKLIEMGHRENLTPYSFFFFSNLTILFNQILYVLHW